ncbi:hypothetical protein P3T76_012185 [Phytophthora citrophthora]|uniref:Retrotransposon gag domain-containing protein n=1 Tax=Phytophthora citrophthora TaxID=4793 RepID=A0AAD9LDN2_9STRA|nr:hypothetical protein P3T76_012185 [Phytophthora citrophthora]
MSTSRRRRSSGDPSSSSSRSDSGSDSASGNSDSSSFEDASSGVTTTTGPNGTTTYLFKPFVNVSTLEDFDEKAPLSTRMRWLERFQSMSVQGGWADNVKIYEIKLKLSPAVRNWRANLTPKVRRKWKDFFKAFKERFCKAKTSDAERYDTMVQKKNETPLDFYYRLNKVADRAGVDIDGSDKSGKVT